MRIFELTPAPGAPSMPNPIWIVFEESPTVGPHYLQWVRTFPSLDLAQEYVAQRGAA